MKIGIVKEIKPCEYRVGATPTAVTELTRRGHEVYVETMAGVGSGFSDADYAEAGAKVVFCDIKQEFVDKGLAAYQADGIDAKGYVCDVTDEDAVNALVATVEKEVGIIDILVKKYINI